MSEGTPKPKKARYHLTKMDIFMALVGVVGVILFIVSATNLATAWLELPLDERPYLVDVSVEFENE